jgi:hypothetical protein
LHALRAVGDELVAGPPSRLDAAAQVVDLILRNLDFERSDLDPVPVVLIGSPFPDVGELLACSTSRHRQIRSK